MKAAVTTFNGELFQLLNRYPWLVPATVGTYGFWKFAQEWLAQRSGTK
ncbi:hypothetical protein [Lactiplantibacillus garii]|nr:hypothetical protein [Lactiplantibacillus garii]